MLAAGVGAVGYFAYKYLFGKNESGQDPDIDEIMETAEEEVSRTTLFAAYTSRRYDSKTGPRI